MDANLTFFKTSPLPPSKRRNEIVYDSQGVRERTFSRLIDNFYLFQRIYSLAGASLQLVPIIRELLAPCKRAASSRQRVNDI